MSFFQLACINICCVSGSAGISETLHEVGGVDVCVATHDDETGMDQSYSYKALFLGSMNRATKRTSISYRDVGAI